MAIAISIMVWVLLGVATRALVRRSKDTLRECALCAQAAESLAPYLETVRAYDAAKARLRDAGSIAKVPEPPLGVPQAERASERGTAIDDFIAIRETFSWPSLKTGQAFAILESFSASGPWRIAAVRLRALPDGENASLSVTLECAEPADGRRE